MSVSRLFGLIGNPVSHSLSRDYFLNKFQKENIAADYQLFQLDSIRQLPELLKNNPSLEGFNVTYPFKQDIIPLLDFVSPDAEQINAVNVVKVVRRENVISLRGYNSDFIGFRNSLVDNYNGALVLGTGGAARAVAYALNELLIPFLFVSRNSLVKENCIGYQQIDKPILKKYPLIVNATPVGLNSETEKPSFPYDFLTSYNILYDLNYSPLETAFMREGMSHGCQVKNGLVMLFSQAEESWLIWNE